MKTLVTCIVIIVLAVPAAAMNAAHDNRVIVGEHAAPDNPSEFEKHNRTVDIDELRRQDIIATPEHGLAPTGAGLEYINSCFWSDCYDIHAEDGIIYCALTYGLMILDVRGGLPFDVVSTLYLQTYFGRGAQLEKHGDYIYFTRASEVVAIDVSDIYNPLAVGSYPSQGKFITLTYADDVLFLVDEIVGYPPPYPPPFTYHLTMLDVSDPSSPALLGTCTDLGNRVYQVAVQDGIAFVSTFKGFHVISVTDPGNPAILASTDMYTFRNAIVSDSVAYAVKTADVDSVIIFSLSDPTNPVRIGAHEYSDPKSSSYNILLADSLLITVCDIIDVSDPSAPASICTYSIQCGGTGLGLWGDYLYRSRPSYINMYDITNIEEPYYVDSYTFSGTVYDVQVRENLAYVALLGQGPIIILDISDLHRPVVIGEVKNTIYKECIDVKDNILCNGRDVVDISDPAHPILMAKLKMEYYESPLDVCLKDNLAFVVRDNKGLRVFDLSDPSNPVLLSSYAADFHHHAKVAVKDTLAFLSTLDTDAGVHIINYANPSSPELIGTYGIRNCMVVAIDENIMYTSPLGSLHVVDISDPGNPALLSIYEFSSRYPMFAPRAMVPQGDYLYVADKARNLMVFDVSDPTNPLYVAVFRTPSSGTENLFLVDDTIFLADNYGLMFLRTPYNAPPARTVCFDIKPGSCPNPLNWRINPHGKAVLPVAILGSKDLDVYDIDVTSVRLFDDLESVRYSYEDVAAPGDSAGGDCACTEEGADGYLDLTLKFDKRSVLEKLHAMPQADQYIVTVTALLASGERIEGHDCVHPVGQDEGGSDAAGPVADGGSEKARPLTDAQAENVKTWGNYPNPFNPTTEIKFNLPEASRVIVDVYNSAGQRVITLADEYFSAGAHTVRWDGRRASGQRVASGVYFYRIQTNKTILTRKMLLLK